LLYLVLACSVRELFLNLFHENDSRSCPEFGPET